jgi:hypothetical protein
METAVGNEGAGGERGMIVEKEEQPKIALWGNWAIRDNGTHKRMSITLKEMLGDNFRRMSRPPRPQDDPKWADLNLFCDDGLNHESWLPPHPSAGWFIDTHLDPDGVRIKWAREFTWSFCAQQSGVMEMKKAGIKNVSWLPLAAHPIADRSRAELIVHFNHEIQKLKTAMHDVVDEDERERHRARIAEYEKNKELDKQYDVCFVGFLGAENGEGFNNRVDYLDAVFSAADKPYLAFNRFFEEAAIRYARSKVGFNISIKRDLNMRVPEVFSYGTCLLTNRNVDGLEDLGIIENVHYVGYEGKEEAVEKLNWCLENPIEREEIAQAGHKLVREKHLYRHRMEQMLSVCGVKNGSA